MTGEKCGTTVSDATAAGTPVPCLSAGDRCFDDTCHVVPPPTPLSTAAIVGIVIGVIAVIGICAAMIWFFMCKKPAAAKIDANAPEEQLESANAADVAIEVADN